MSNYINMESFGSECPANWREIASALNAIIDERGIADDHDAVNALWEDWCNGDLTGVPAPASLWYAVQRDPEDDWGTGSFDLAEAKRMAARQLPDYPQTLIAVIENDVCIEEITDFEV